MAEIILREQGGRDAERTEAFKDSFDIMAEDGSVLYTVRLYSTGTLEVSSIGGLSRHAGRMLSSQLAVRPYSTNCLFVAREGHSTEGGNETD